MERQNNHQKGFTLIEVMIAIAVAAIGIMAVGVMQTSSVRSNDSAQTLTRAANIGEEFLEAFMALPYDDPLLQDTDGDGTGQDANGNSIDVNDETGNTVLDDRGDQANFGLHHATTAHADHYCGVTPLGPNSRDARLPVDVRYDVFWNIAEGVPYPDSKLIRVIIRWDEGGRGIGYRDANTGLTRTQRQLVFNSAKRRW